MDRLDDDRERKRRSTTRESETGAEEFSEGLYEDNAPVADDFVEPHQISSTGALIHRPADDGK